MLILRYDKRKRVGKMIQRVTSACKCSPLTLQEGICFDCTFAETSLLHRGWHGFSFSYSNQTVTFLLLICPSGLLDHNIAFFTTRSHHKITLIRSLKFECLPSLFVCLAVTRFWHVVFPFACITNASYPLFSN